VRLVELTAVIAWENFRSRFNHAVGIEAHGFAENGVWALPA
jgi:alkylhydroperoxidase family enzyme